MHIRQLTAATTAFLRHPRTATIAFYVATAAIVLKLSPSILEFLGCSRTVLMDALYIIYESDTIRAALNLTAMLAMAVLWLVLSRMFPKEARLMRYTTFALAAMIALHAVWFMTESIFFPPVQALAQHDNATAISSMVTAIVGNAGQPHHPRRVAAPHRALPRPSPAARHRHRGAVRTLVRDGTRLLRPHIAACRPGMGILGERDTPRAAVGIEHHTALLPMACRKEMRTHWFSTS